MSAHPEYYPDPEYSYVPEYTAPADLSWQDKYHEQLMNQNYGLTQHYGRINRLKPESKPVLRLVSRETHREVCEPDAPMPMLRLVPLTSRAPLPEDGRARLAYHTRGIEEACQILEDDPQVGSWDVSGSLHRLRKLYRQFRRRERGIE